MATGAGDCGCLSPGSSGRWVGPICPYPGQTDPPHPPPPPPSTPPPVRPDRATPLRSPTPAAGSGPRAPARRAGTPPRAPRAAARGAVARSRAAAPPRRPWTTAASFVASGSVRARVTVVKSSRRTLIAIVRPLTSPFASRSQSWAASSRSFASISARSARSTSNVVSLDSDTASRTGTTASEPSKRARRCRSRPWLPPNPAASLSSVAAASWPSVVIPSAVSRATVLGPMPGINPGGEPANRSHASSRDGTTDARGFSASDATLATSRFGPMPTDASRRRSPRGRGAVPGGGVRAVRRLAAGLIPGIGPKTVARLTALGITTLGQLAAATEERLAAGFGGNHGRDLQRRARSRALTLSCPCARPCRSRGRRRRRRPRRPGRDGGEAARARRPALRAAREGRVGGGRSRSRCASTTSRP